MKHIFNNADSLPQDLCGDNVTRHRRPRIILFIALAISVALTLFSPDWAFADYKKSVVHGNWSDWSIWGIWDESADPDTLIPPPQSPPSSGEDIVISSIVTISVGDIVSNGGTLTMYYWSGELHIEGTFSNNGTMNIYSRNPITGSTLGSEFRNYGEINLYAGYGWDAVLTGNIINYGAGTINALAIDGSGASYLGPHFENHGNLSIESGNSMYLNLSGPGNILDGNVQCNGWFRLAQLSSDRAEVTSNFSGTGTINLGGHVTFPSTITIASPLNLGVTKFGEGTIISTGQLELSGAIVEGILDIRGSASGPGCNIGDSGTIINNGYYYTGYGAWGGSGLFINNGTFVFGFEIGQAFYPDFENHGLYVQSGACLNFYGSFVSDGDMEITSGTNGCLPSGTIPHSADNTLPPYGGSIYIRSGATLNSGSINFNGDTLDNAGHVNSTFTFVRSSTPQVLTGGGTISQLAVNGGNVQMIGPQSANSNLTIASGTLHLYDGDLNLGDGTLSGATDSGYIVTNGAGRLIRNVGTSFVNFPVGTSDSYNPVTVRTETGIDGFAVSVAGGIVTSMASTSSSPAVDRTWSISEATPGGNGLITFTTQWNSGEEGSVFVRDSAEGWRKDGGWIMQSGSLVEITPSGYPALATITTSSLSSWAVANFDTPPLYSPGVIGFGDVYLNSSRSDTVWVKNNNFFTLNIDSVISTNDRFTVTPSSAVVVAAESTSFEITFTPDSITSENGSVVFYSNMSSSPDTVSVAAVGSLATVSVPLLQGWNLISNPVSRNPGTDSVHHLYPGSVFDYAFAFESSSGYSQQFTLENGVGFWGKFSSPDTNAITGLYKPTDSVIVNPGWNIIGTVTDPVDTGSVVSDPPGLRISPWYGYEGTYITPTVLQPGKGYWVKASAPGVFIFAPTLSLSSSRRSDGEKSNAVVDEFIVKERSGVRRALYLESAKTDAGMMSELPPPGPEGTFDARFESQLSIESMSENGDKAIVIRSTSYPVTFSWNTTDREYILRDGVTGTLFPPRTISGKGEMTITNPAVTRLLLTLDDAVPHEFSLFQNYPNPFNPTTEIKFSVDKMVRTSLEVYDVLGQRVAVLFNENAEPGKYYTARMDGLNMASGVYFYTLRSGARVESRKMLLLK